MGSEMCIRDRSHTQAHTSPLARKLVGESLVLVVTGHRLVKDVISTLHNRLGTSRMQSYFVSRRVPNSGLHSISLDSLGYAMQQLSFQRRIWTSKMFFGFGPTGRNMLRRGHWEHSHCPRCGDPEDLHHILLCPSSQAIEIRQNWLRSFSPDPSGVEH